MYSGTSLKLLPPDVRF